MVIRLKGWQLSEFACPEDKCGSVWILALLDFDGTAHFVNLEPEQVLRISALFRQAAEAIDPGAFMPA